MPLFGEEASPAVIIKGLLAALEQLDATGKESEKAQEDATRYLSHMKNVLYGTCDQEPQEELVAQLCQEIYNHDLFTALIKKLNMIDTESKKDIARMFETVLRRQVGPRLPTVDFFCYKSDILFTLLKGYESQEIALTCDTMLRECCRYEPLANRILKSDEFYDLFDYVETPTLDIASDALVTLKDLLTRHSARLACFLDDNYDKVIKNWGKLLNSENYAGHAASSSEELLFGRSNLSFMTKYVSNQENLNLMMNMMMEKGNNAQFEAFHVFKVFAANPNKPKPILEVLLQNREKLVEFLEDFGADRLDDEQFIDEKAYLIKQIKELQ